MIVFLGRSLAATAAAAALAAAVFFAAVASRDTGIILGKALENLENAKTLHLSIVQAGKTAEVWASGPQRLRWNNPDGTYQVAHGARTWLVDEKANRAASRPSTYFRGDRPGPDALALLGLGEVKDRDKLLSQRPAEKIEREGVAYVIYRCEIPDPAGKIHLEALVDPATQLLRSLETKVDRDGKLHPLAKLTVLAVDQPVKEELFVVGDTLTEDGRIGKVVDAEGIVSIKPVMANRWTPLAEGLLIKPGDWLQTDIRGANAVAVRLAGATDVTLGPGTLVELVSPTEIKLFEGEIKVVAGGKRPVDVIGPDRQKFEVRGREIYRIRDEKLVRFDGDPQWLKGFEGRAVGESIGSLVAKVEGRNVPLTVGYHKVSVEIRDQIARTTIEESFVNHTAGRLEGVFHFPLPQDASIAGFGMWIGNELVEADVVEKQRAREIYEIIKRERRDPGLLEWSGGNLFTARVFPIEPRSEKRIKIVYTQVLPLKGSSYRYSYGLQSEMLKQHPLRELSIDLKLNSVVPLASVTSPTHTVRADQTKHSAHLEFTAQEYTPTRDFEAVVEIDVGQIANLPGSGQVGNLPHVVLIPHRRGEDGYFMLMVTPPAAAGQSDREILPDGEPLDLLVLADTSASLDTRQRASQGELIASLLGALTPRDKFNLACCDVECDWVFEKSVPAEGKSVAAARQVLAERVSLGWTDLDKAFAAAISRCGPKTRVVYVGDGIPTTTDVDPVAFTQRLRRMYEGKSGTFYAVSVGSTFESGVLKAIASLGGGSVRQIGGEHGPRAVALDLLGEFARPALRGLKVEFRGLRTARVYPQELPNIPAGSQLILLGRYLPEGRDQQGEVVVTGMQGEKPIRMAAKVSLKDAEEGNSFIPRLWARMHLDALLAQGTSQAIQDEIIALSEEYHIITPYTSLLVLETDADRERFQVKRRFQMRDGEKFFAEGRANVNYELVQQQMKRAGNWRLGLRRAVLQQLSTLGRNPRMFQGQQPYFQRGYGVVTAGESRYNWLSKSGGGTVSLGRPVATHSLSGYDMNGPWSGEADYGAPSLYSIAKPVWESTLSESNMRWRGGADGSELLLRDGDRDKKDFIQNLGERMSTDEGGGGLENLERLDKLDMAWKSEAEDREEVFFAAADKRPVHFASDFVPEEPPIFYPDADPFGYRGTINGRMSGLEVASRITGARYRLAYGDMPWSERYRPTGEYTQWLNTLFPQLPLPPPAKEIPPPPVKTPWPPEARKLAEGLLRTAVLANLKDGLAIERQTESYDARSGELSSRSGSLTLVSPGAWLVRSEADGSQTTVQWCDSKQRGIFGKAFQLGRLRTATPQELRKPPLSLSQYVLNSIEQTYQTWTPELRPQPSGETLLVLKQPEGSSEIHVLIDTGRRVITSIARWHEGKVTWSEKASDFVEAAGAWWAGRIESFDDKGRRTSVTTQKFNPLAADAFARQMQAELAAKDRVQFLQEPGRLVREAKRALAAGKADFDDRMTLLLHFARSQQWTRVMEQLDAAEKLAAGKPGMRWVRDAVLGISRRGEELKKRVLAEAAVLAKPQADEIFLAGYLLGQAGSVCNSNEMLSLLDALKPVYQRQPAYRKAVKSWKQSRLNWLQNASRYDEAMALHRQLAEENPRDYHLQQQYAQALSNRGEWDAAYAWLKRALAAKVDWLPYEAESLRSAYTQLLQSQGRYAEILDYLSEWIKQNPEGQSAYQQYLSALIRVDRVDQANKLIAAWLKEGQQPGRLPPPVLARLEAAVSQALGQGYNMHTNRLEEQWLRPLAEVALFFARHPHHASVAERIMGHWQFQQTDECRGVRKAVLAMLEAEMGKLTPAEIQRLVHWITPNDPAVEVNVWKRLAAGLQQRWSAEARPQVKHQLGQSLVQVLGRVGSQQYLAFLRVQVAQGPAEYRQEYIRQLFDALLSQPWDEKYENEALSLLEKLSDAEEPAVRLAAQLEGLHRLVDRMVFARYTLLMGKVEHQEELSRTDLKAKQAENLRLAREGLCNRLAKELARADLGAALRPWMNIERLYLEVLLGRNLDKVAAECWEFLGPRPGKAPAEDDPLAWLDETLRNRFLITAANLAARKNADPSSIERLLKYVDAAIAQDAEDLRWKLLKYQLLIALDRPKDLQQALEAWTKQDDPDNRWRLSLGYLLAEQGKLEEAIAHFEAIAAADELGPAEYRALADWYMVVDRRAQHERAKIEMYKLMEEYHLSRWLGAKLQPWRQSTGHLPSQLDDEVLLVFAALFEKSNSPQNYLWQLREFYQATRDFRLLRGLADAVVGHTAGKVYPFVRNVGSVLSEVRDEATADEIVEHLAKVRQRAKTHVDQRALDIVELQVERRAAELLNQPGPHAEKALAAMQRAFKRQWTPGEPRLMAELLEGLGSMSQPALAKEHLRQLQALHAMEAKGSFDRLQIARWWAGTLWNYSRRSEAIDVLQAALDEYEQACGGVLPTTANDTLYAYLSYLEQVMHHARAEQVIFGQLKHPANEQQKFWLIQQLFWLYESAVRRDGEVSLGKGIELYRAVERRFFAELDTADQNHRYALISRLCNFYRTAHEKKIAAAAGDLRAFAFKRLPAILKGQTSNYQSIVTEVARTLHDVAGPRDGLAFLIERIEQEPGWFRLNNQDGWSQFGWNLSHWRWEVRDKVADLEPRLLKIVLAELRQDLLTRQSRNRNIYHAHHSYWWSEKAADFARVAEEVYAQRRKSGVAVAYIAEYMYHGLTRHDRAIEMLLIAQRDKLLDESGQSQLVRFLHERGRYGESIAILQPLIELRPDNMQYRVWLMHAYFRTGQREQLLGLLEQTDAYFHKGGRWNEGAMASLARSCLENQLYEQSAKYFQEVIALHQRTQPRRGIGNGTLSAYYRDMAQAYAGLKKTAEAVDAACGAIVSWGPRHEKRAEALDALRSVIRQAPDLDAYIAELDRQAAETKEQNPLVRKAIGQVYLEKQQYAKAIVQLRIACEVQPNDTETHNALVQCFDKQKDQQGAIGQMLQSLQLSRRNIHLYDDLGRRFQDSGKPQQAERAYSSIVEVLPHEAESHELLAGIRQRQDRWDQAIFHWQQMARLQALEPNGLLQLAGAQLHQKQWEAAEQTIRKLRARTWPPRFSDVEQRIRQLEQQLQSGRPK